MSATDTASAASRALNVPGLRTLRSRSFRLALAVMLLAVGWCVLGFVLWRQATDPAGQWAFDFQAWYVAAGQMAAGHPPYAPEMFDGPIAAQGAVLYKSPPLVAQLLLPLAVLPMSAAALVWFAAQAAAIFGSTLMAARIGGAPRSAETIAWSAVAATFFLPNFDTLWKGNVSGFVALVVAMSLAGGVAAGVGGAAAGLLKTTAGVLVVPALFGGRRVWSGLLAVALAVAVSFALAPVAWLDFVRILPNLIAGSTHFATNLAPHNLVAFGLPGLSIAADATRAAAVVIGSASLIGAIVLARRGATWPVSVVLAVVAMLLLPTSMWYHYLAALLPLAAFAWARASSRQRSALFAGGAAVSLGLAWFPLVIAGAALTVVSSLFAIWPRPRPAA